MFYGSVVVVLMLCARIAPIAANVPALIGQRIEQILPDHGVNTAGQGQAAAVESWLEGSEADMGRRRASTELGLRTLAREIIPVTRRRSQSRSVGGTCVQTACHLKRIEQAAYCFAILVRQ